MEEQEQKITFQVAAGVPLPVRVTAAPGFNRQFSERGPHECGAADWKKLEGIETRLQQTERNATGEEVIVGGKHVPMFERVTPPAESKLRMFGRKKDGGEAEPSPAS